MQPVPFECQSQRPRREFPIHDAGLDFDRDLELPISRMKMRRSVVTIEHCDDYPKEPTDFRHMQIYSQSHRRATAAAAGKLNIEVVGGLLGFARTTSASLCGNGLLRAASGAFI